MTSIHISFVPLYQVVCQGLSKAFKQNWWNTWNLKFPLNIYVSSFKAFSALSWRSCLLEMLEKYSILRSFINLVFMKSSLAMWASQLCRMWSWILLHILFLACWLWPAPINKWLVQKLILTLSLTLKAQKITQLFHCVCSLRTQLLAQSSSPSNIHH